MQTLIRYNQYEKIYVPIIGLRYDGLFMLKTYRLLTTVLGKTRSGSPPEKHQLYLQGKNAYATS